MHIEKYHASLNDFLIIETNKTNLNESAKKLLNRYNGIGGDGLITFNKQTKEVHFYNQDGSLAKLCINGLRCLSLYVVRKYGLEDDIVFTLGERYYQALIKSLDPYIVDLKLLSFKYQIVEKFLDIESIYPIGFVDVGNKHIVVVVDEINDLDSLLEDIKHYTLEGYNINFVNVINKNKIRVITYERGVGYTMSCGSGSLASALYLNKLGLINEKVEVITLVDSFFINLKGEVSIRGAANYIFEVEYDI